MIHVILAGGSGSRFWPYSTKKRPKQLLKIIDNKSMIKLTIDRILEFSSIEKIYVVASNKLCKLIHQEIPLLPKSNLIVEPNGKNTAPAIGLAAIHLYKKDPNAIMSIYPADQIINNNEEFKKTILLSEEIIKSKPSLITIGINPKYPATGYGYIQYNKNKNRNYYKVKTFAEKPPYNTALKFIESGDFLWNSGIFIWEAKMIILEIKTFMPELHESLSAIYDSINTNNYQIVLKQEWNIIQSLSIDYGVLEKAKNVYTIKGDFQWIDIGSWKSLFDYLKKDSKNNVVKGNVINIDTQDSLIFSPNNLTAIIGMKDIAVVNIDGTTLIMPLNRSEEVKEIVTLLNNKRDDSL